jgi:hypothetical protein
MADPKINDARGVFTGTTGAAMTAGDLAYFDGSNWVLADATDNTKFAEAFAVSTVASGDVGIFATNGILEDTDAAFTQGDDQMLSATATVTNTITSTRPTGAENLVQVVGYALSTSLLNLAIQIPKEVMVNVMLPYAVHAAPVDRDNDFVGIGLDDTNAEAGGSFMVPQNCVSASAEMAYLWWSGTGVLLDTSDTYTIDVSGGIDDETTTATVDGIGAASLAVAANDLNRADVSAAFTTTGLIAPGNIIGVVVKKAAEGSGGDDPIMLSCQVILHLV